MTFIYKIISIDVDGDKVSDGDLFLKFKQLKKNGEVSLKLVDAKFVDNKSIKKLVKNIAKDAKQQSGGSVVKKAADATNTQEPIQIQDKTTFGQYMKQYFVAGFAASAGKAVFDGVASMFSSEES
jgi:hypothetical protein